MLNHRTDCLMRSIFSYLTERFMMNIQTVLTSSLLLLTAVASTSHAEIGEVTVNGKPIPQILFLGYTKQRMLSKDVCSPTSDARIRDGVLRQAIRKFGAEDNNLKPDEDDLERVALKKQERDYLKDGGGQIDLAIAEYMLFESETSSYSHHYHVGPTHDQILDEYKKRIKAGDPKFTNVKIVRYTPMEFRTAADADTATKLLETGTAVSDIEAKYDNGYFSTHLAEFWSLLHEVDQYTGDGIGLKTGSIYRQDDINLIYFDEVKHRTRIYPFTSYQNWDDYAYKEIKWDLSRQLQFERDVALWNAADVREDGEPIKLSANYPSCP